VPQPGCQTDHGALVEGPGPAARGGMAPFQPRRAVFIIRAAANRATLGRARLGRAGETAGGFWRRRTMRRKMLWGRCGARRTARLRLRLLSRGADPVPVLPRLGGCRHRGARGAARARCRALTWFPSPRSEGFAHKPRVPVQRQAAGRAAMASGNASATPASARSLER